MTYGKPGLSFKIGAIFTFIILATVFSIYAFQNDSGISKNNLKAQNIRSFPNYGKSSNNPFCFKTKNRSKYILVQSSLTWREFIAALKNVNVDDNVLKEFDRLFKLTNSKGVLLECKPFSWNTSENSLVEFRIIKDNYFNTAKQDSLTFGEKFNRLCPTESEEIISFDSLSGNVLITPCPFSVSGRTTSTHLKVFMETASQDHKRKLFQMIGNELEKVSQQNPAKGIWLSTHGKGVDWLHIRVCLQPSYYTTKQYIHF